MNMQKSLLFSIMIGLSACSQISETDTPQTVVDQLTGTWISKNHDGEIIFYSDKTAKMVFNNHQPPIKFISTYETIKGERIAINLGGYWSGPAFINTSKLQEQHLTVIFPDEKP
ncbi:MAG: hypothetical protein Q9M14_08220, partial [Mariprofundaceae bacterium]|nr:hypothetical protein [Mariprofundaceae bacterium]